MNKKNEYALLIAYFEKRYYLLPHYFCDKEYLDQEYLPKLKRLQSIIEKKDIGIVAGAYEKIADMYDCLIASNNKAIEFFKLSIGLVSEFYYSYGEIAWTNFRMGNYNVAIKNYNIALKKTNDTLIRSELLDGRKMAQLAKKNNDKPVVDCCDFHYIAKDKLLFGNPDEALSLLKNKNDNESRMLCLICYLAKQDFDQFYIQLKKLISAKSLVYFTNCFWFYLPKQIKNDLKFWAILYSRQGKTSFIHSELPSYLQKMYRAKYKRSNTADNSKTYKLYFQFQMAKLSLDKKLITKLASAHPKWRQAQTLLNERIRTP